MARYGLVCDSETSDGRGCGCGRGFPGLQTHKATTTVMVVDRDITEAEWRRIVHDSLHATGWAERMLPDELADYIDAITELDLRSVADLAVGTVLGRRAWNNECGCTVDELRVRREAAAR